VTEKQGGTKQSDFMNAVNKPPPKFNRRPLAIIRLREISETFRK